MKEQPGAQLPWLDIHQLLAPDERFEAYDSDSHWKGFLLAPKHSSQLAALLYRVHQHDLEFCVQGRGNEKQPQPHHLLMISARAFSQLVLHEEGIVEVGAGCILSHLHQFLYDNQQEIALEEDPISSSKRSVGGVILSGKTGGISYRQETMREMMLGVEFVTWEGGQVKWGGGYRSGLAGPPLHKLVWNSYLLPGVITKFYLKIYPIPQMRLRLTWSFRERQALWNHFYLLKDCCASWEILDCVQSGRVSDQGFIFAQISGLKEEIELFSQVCPGYHLVRKKDEREILRCFLKQQKLQISVGTLLQDLQPGEYLWYHGLEDKIWWLNPRKN